ncbi:hypothetical protein [Streptomyces sp. NPDC102437]|uniref:hypothetical protein n=1 Tax=Streptomyces sp. NPDC102437 TaxID=3366175 RepID=UPI00382EF4C6
MGFQVKGAAREQLECIAAAGNGRYYDAPDADSLARQLQRASQLSVDGYRFRGERVPGTATAAEAPVLAPGQYLDTIGPGEQRYYAVDLDAASTADFSATAVPQPGAAVDTFDAMRTSIAYGTDSSCGSETAHFFQKEGASPLTSAIARIPSARGTSRCDRAGRYWLVVEGKTKKGSDAARWPLGLVHGVEEPLRKGVQGPGRLGPAGALRRGVRERAHGGAGRLHHLLVRSDAVVHTCSVPAHRGRRVRPDEPVQRPPGGDRDGRCAGRLDRPLRERRPGPAGARRR